MKKENSVSDIQAEQLPFSFIRKEIDSGKAKANWQKIKTMIGSDLSKFQSREKSYADDFFIAPSEGA